MTDATAPRYQIKSLTDHGRLIAYVVYDHTTRDEYYTVTLSNKLPAEQALTQAREKCAILNKQDEATK